MPTLSRLNGSKASPILFRQRLRKVSKLLFNGRVVLNELHRHPWLSWYAGMLNSGNSLAEFIKCYDTNLPHDAKAQHDYKVRLLPLGRMHSHDVDLQRRVL